MNKSVAFSAIFFYTEFNHSHVFIFACVRIDANCHVFPAFETKRYLRSLIHSRLTLFLSFIFIFPNWATSILLVAAACQPWIVSCFEISEYLFSQF
jgi:hypothetical protein